MKSISTIFACSATLAFSGLAFAGPAEDIIASYWDWPRQGC